MLGRNEDVETQSEKGADDSTAVEEYEPAFMVPSECNYLYAMFTFDKTFSKRKNVCLAIEMPSSTKISYGLFLVGKGHVLQFKVILPPFFSCA